MSATKTIFILLIFLSSSKIFADTYYVSHFGSDTFPYTNWTAAAHSIQDAVFAATAGDTVIVTNGVYKTGGVTAPGFALMNTGCLRKGCSGKARW